MKKFQLRIAIEQKQTWRISRLPRAGQASYTTDAELISLTPIEETKICAPVIYRRISLLNIFSVCRDRVFRLRRLPGRKGTE